MAITKTRIKRANTEAERKSETARRVGAVLAEPGVSDLVELRDGDLEEALRKPAVRLAPEEADAKLQECRQEFERRKARSSAA